MKKAYVCLGFEPVARGWYAQMKLRSYGGLSKER